MAKVPEEIRKAWANQNLIPVVGAGVSMGAAGLPNWPGLLTRGIEYARSKAADLHCSPEAIDALEAAARAHQLLNGFGQLQDILGGAPDGIYYQAFLDEVFSEPAVSSHETLDSLSALGARVVVTTNYDRLLERWNTVKDPEVATWSEPARVLSILRGRRGIIHLHGRWDLPASVILSSADYQRIVDAQQTAAVAGALFHSGVLLFVGCSLDSVQDPHLKGILDRFAALQGNITEGATPHYMLVVGKPDAAIKVKLRKLGIVPVSVGASFADLPAFLRSIPAPSEVSIPAAEVCARLQTIRGATTLDEVLQDAKDFLEHSVFPGRKVRMGFAVKSDEQGRTILRNRYLLPTPATHNEFSYPQTLAAWALVEGRVFSFPADWDRPCDFALVRKLRKLNRIRAALLATDASADPILADYLNPEAIKSNTASGALTMRDLYQHWVGSQPNPHYQQFISVPVPVVETTTNRKEPPEYGVLNIDTNEEEPLLTGTTLPLLKMVSEFIALAFEHLQPKSA